MYKKHQKAFRSYYHKQFSPVEAACVSSGYKAFRMKIYPDGNPYRQSKQRTLWLRGYRQAEREFAQQIALSRAIESSLPLENE